VALRDPQNQILMVRTRRFPGRWQPVGGGVEESDRTPQEAAQREVREETRLLLNCADIHFVTQLPYDFGEGTVYCFEAEFDPDRDQPSFNDEEVVEHRWIHVDEASSLEMFPATAKFVDKLRQERKC
jgi:8-oxo-dGTP pyrophosphatase MutT (NUDIX family)